MSLGFRVAKLFHQCIFYLLGQFIGEVAVPGVEFSLETLSTIWMMVIDVICQCLFLLLFADIALFKHVLQDDLALFRVGFLTADRV